MIVGVGTDLVEIARIERSLDRFAERFASKILTSSELALFRAKPSAAFLAKRFAAKEAVAKALGTGMRAGVHFAYIEITHEPSGKPGIELHGSAAQRANELAIQHWHLSISDEKQHALAFVVAEG